MYKLLTQRRIALNMTIEELATKSGVPRNTVAKIMSGITTDPRLSSFKLICHALGLNLDDLENNGSQNKLSMLPVKSEAMQLASVGVRIRIARTAANLKQEDVARKLGISKSNISEWETGKRSPGIDQMEDIAEALNTTSSYLLGFDNLHSSSTELSPEGYQQGLDFDNLTEEGQRLARGFMALVLQVHRKP